MNIRETTTVLAALRYWQRDIGTQARAAAAFPEHFEDTVPLSGAEIDALCERLNTTEDVEAELTRLRALASARGDR